MKKIIINTEEEKQINASFSNADGPERQIRKLVQQKTAPELGGCR